eukprot:GEMP01062107.1.p1 GENE.GEMP01062107.1~~GEMP01062107.1.p1  ORF type:complete len:203 (+),score=35.46 GEMP01062107.1:143-751(+)
MVSAAHILILCMLMLMTISDVAHFVMVNIINDTYGPFYYDFTDITVSLIFVVFTNLLAAWTTYMHMNGKHDFVVHIALLCVLSVLYRAPGCIEKVLSMGGTWWSPPDEEPLLNAEKIAQSVAAVLSVALLLTSFILLCTQNAVDDAADTPRNLKYLDSSEPEVPFVFYPTPGFPVPPLSMTLSTQGPRGSEDMESVVTTINV